MKKSQKCPKCGSGDILKDVFAVDRGHGNSTAEMTLATFGRPEALIFKQAHKTSVSAWVCASCGFVEYYADNPASLRLPAS